MTSRRLVNRPIPGEKKPNRNSVGVFRTLATLRFALEKTGVGLEAFSREYVDRGYSNSSLFYRWTHGETSMGENTARRLDAFVGGLRLASKLQSKR
jgi:hypothetical protein